MELRARSQSFRAFRALVRADARELRRDRFVGVSTLTMALVLLILHGCMWLAFSVAGATPRVDVSGLAGPHASAVATALDELRGDGAPAANGPNGPNGPNDPNAPAHTVRVQSAGERIVIAVDEPRVGWDPVWRAVRAAGVPAGQIDVLGRDGEPIPDFLRLNLGTILVAALASIALLGTAVPLIAARGRGTLRLLGTTPLPRSLMLLSRVPNRLALVLVSVSGVIGIAVLTRAMEPASLPRLLVSVCCALVLLFGFAALAASRASDPEASQGLLVGVCFALLASAGSVLPVTLLPEPLRIASGLLPGAWLVEPASADLAGTSPLLPVPAYWGLCLAAGLACFMLAARRFTWEPRPERARTHPIASDRPQEARP